MEYWDRHDFDKSEEEKDEHDPHLESYEPQLGSIISRNFVLESKENRKKYTITFEEVLSHRIMDAFVGDLQNVLEEYKFPESGVWVVNFDRSDETYADSGTFKHVDLNITEKRQLITEVACAIRDHYNFKRPGLYCWLAATDELVGIYDSALGFIENKKPRFKFVQKAIFFNRLTANGRGYAVITQYY